MLDDLLKTCGYPTNTLVLDCESYFDKDYSLSKLSTYEFVTDGRFAVLGWASKVNSFPAKFGIDLPEHVNWKNTTIVMHNASFDALVLAKHCGIHPPYIIDTLDLARHVESRWSNTLAALCERHGLPAKGDTKQFKGFHRTEMDGELWCKLIDYATNDAEREYDLLQLLLPKLSNPKFELEIAQFTRDLFIKPVLHFNVDRARKLREDIQVEITKALVKVDWILDYAD